MPNPLSSAYNWMTTPVVPKKVIEPAQQFLEEPHLDQSPLMAGIKGFGSGALEGLRGLSTPLNIASAALPMLRGGSVAGEAVGGLKGALSAGGGLEDLAGMPAEFQTAASEPLYNTARSLAQKVADPVESAYQRLAQGGGAARPVGESVDTMDMVRRVQAAKDARRAAEGIDTSRGGWGSEAGKLNISPEQGLIGAGALGGLAYYGGKLAKKVMGGADQANHQLNSFQKYNDMMDQANKPKTP